MVASAERSAPLAVVEVPLKQIKVSTRLRSTDEDKVNDLAESIEGIGLLHSITVSKHGEWFHLLSGMHRLEAFRKLGRDTIPASINKSDRYLSAKLSACDAVRGNIFNINCFPLMAQQQAHE